MSPVRDWVTRHAIDVTPLRSPPYRRMFVGNLVSFFGYQFTGIAVPVQMYDITRSAFWIGLLGLAGLLPLVLFALWGGAIADAFDRRRVLLASSVVMWLGTIGLLVASATGLRSPLLLLVLVAVQAAAFAVSSPTRTAIIPRLIPEGKVAAAQTLNYTTGTIGLVLGPLAAGVLLSQLGLRAGVPAAYAVDGLAFTVALWAAFRLPEMPPERGERRLRSTFGDLRDGLRYLAGSRVILLTFAIDIVAMVLALPRALFPVVADERLGVGSLGWLYSAIAIGSVVAGLTSGWVGRIRRQGLAVVIAVVGWGLAVAVSGLMPWLWAVCLMLGVAGAADMISAVYRQTMLLTYAPDEMRGRLQGVFFAVVAGGPRLGDLRAGGMAELTGTTVSWVSGGLAAAAVAVVIALGFPALVRYTKQPG